MNKLLLMGGRKRKACLVFVASGVVFMLLLTTCYKETDTQVLLAIAMPGAYLSAWTSTYPERVTRGRRDEQEG